MAGAKRKNPHYTEGDRLTALELHAQGYLQTEIAKETGMAQSTVSELLKKVRTHHTVQDLPKPGAPLKITGKALRFLVLAALRGTMNSSGEMVIHLKTKEGIHVSENCVLLALRREGIQSRRLVWLREPTPKQQQRRVEFARKYRDANFDKWVFSDETGLHRQERGRQKRTFVGRGQSVPTLSTERELAGGGGKINL